MGLTVYAAARRVERMQRREEDGIAVLAMDVTDDASMRAGIERIITETGRIDVLVNNAGYGSYGALEDVEIDEGRRQFEVNVFGAIRLAQLVLPHMRARGAGTIVNISSMGGKIYTPLGGWYHGTKFALEALSDCLRMEVTPFGIDVVVIEPGGIATEWGPIAGDLVEQASGHGPYGRQAAAVVKLLRGETTGGRNSPPGVVADAVGRAVRASRSKTRYAVGFGARPLVLARRGLGDRLFEALITRATGKPRH
ncbi:NAD(P)-dependent dehydrogenase (short-subunit alcohol dehydrogenase family) [Paeniglutamicibacter psychrophenolicus]|nr:NAD(P)-dependent dehydrogenase (short-subunit alcohol dehydrogenase family) [Paeniglutamicibacter psychrophenolicus]